MQDVLESDGPSVQQRVRERWFNDDLKTPPAPFEPRPEAPTTDPLQRFLRDGWTR